MSQDTKSAKIAYIALGALSGYYLVGKTLPFIAGTIVGAVGIELLLYLIRHV